MCVHAVYMFEPAFGASQQCALDLFVTGELLF